MAKEMISADSHSKSESATGTVRLVAVIEIGTSSIRMAVAQIGPDDSVTNLETLQQAVTIGKDTFTKGYIDQQTTEECVRVLRRFSQLLKEYRIAEDGIVAIATSAVREAANRDAFLDRLFIATGLAVNTIDETEVNRFTYLAVRPLLHATASMRKSSVFVIEVGGGSTEALVFKKGVMGTSHTYRLGSLRLRKRLDDQQVSVSRLRSMMQSHVGMMVEQIAREMAAVFGRSKPKMLALGGDARFAASSLVEDWDKKSPATVSVEALAELADQILGLSVDDAVRQCHISYPEAETLGPALLIYAELAKALNIDSICIGSTSLRDGILAETAMHGAWTDEMKQQIVNSAVEVGRKFDFDEQHARYVAELATQLFHFLKDEHRLSPRYELILTVASLLHDIGLYISNRSHHKHSMYLVENSEVFGLSQRDLALVALIARYHRRAMPRPTHEQYSQLDRKHRVIVSKLAAILRVADALGRGCPQLGITLDMALEKGTLIIDKPGHADASLIDYALRHKGNMFGRVYGMKVMLRSSEDAG